MEDNLTNESRLRTKLEEGRKRQQAIEDFKKSDKLKDQEHANWYTSQERVRLYGGPKEAERVLPPEIKGNPILLPFGDVHVCYRWHEGRYDYDGLRDNSIALEMIMYMQRGGKI